MAKWEYLALARVAGAWNDDRFDGRTPEEKLSDLGKEGWELVSVCYDNAGYNYFLKRPFVTRRRRSSTKKTGTRATKTIKSTKTTKK
jgi:hypothetical protein